MEPKVNSRIPHPPIRSRSSQRPAQRPSLNLLIVTLAVTAALPVLFLLARVLFSNEEDALRFSTALTLPALAFFIYTWKRLNDPLFMPYPVFLFSVYAYHFGQFLVQMLGYETGELGTDKTLDLFRFAPETLQDLQVLAWVSIGSLQLGALIARRVYGNADPSHLMQPPPLQFRRSALIVGLFMAAVAFVPAVQQLYQTIAFRSMGTLAAYTATHAQYGVADVRSVVGQALWPGLLFACAAANGRRWVINFTGAFCLLWFVLYTLTGDRSSGVLPAIAFLWIVHTVHKPINFRLLATVGILLAFVVNPIVALTRNNSSLESVDRSGLFSKVFEAGNPIVLFFDETGISAIPLADTLEAVPNDRPFALGRDYLDNLIIGPFSYFGIGDLTSEYGQPAYWLIKTRYPVRLKQSSFLGFSCIAEAYLQFGYLAPFVTMFMGFSLIWLTAKAVRHRTAYIVGGQAILFSYLIHFARGDSGELGRPIVRYILIPIGLMIITERLLRPENRREAMEVAAR